MKMLLEECSQNLNGDSLSNQAVDMRTMAAWAAGAVATEPAAVLLDEFGQKGLFVFLLPVYQVLACFLCMRGESRFHLLLARFSFSKLLLNTMSKVASKSRRPGMSDRRKVATTDGERRSFVPVGCNCGG
jgi:hypothetical protein